MQHACMHGQQADARMLQYVKDILGQLAQQA
jgi:hypothetical protein